IGGGYHVAEIGRAAVEAVDCAGARETRRETRLRLLDGAGGPHMTAGTMRSIIDRGLGALGDAEDGRALVEFGRNGGFAVYAPRPPARDANRFLVRLDDEPALCGPMRRGRWAEDAASGAGAGRTGCC
ncbi:MAG: DUF6428 family protein, partial [Pseudomonadota bacterium]